MGRGGKRQGAGRPATWKSGPASRAIKLPSVLVERVLAYARELDAQTGDTTTGLSAGTGDDKPRGDDKRR